VLALAPAAQARVRPRVRSVKAAAYVDPSASPTRARVVLIARRHATRAVNVVLTLLKGHAVTATVGRRHLAAGRPYATRAVLVPLRVPASVPRGAYALRACVAASCKTTPLTIAGVPNAYEATVTAVETLSGIDAGQVKFTGTMRFNRAAPTRPGNGTYDVASGSGTFTVTGTTTLCAGAATGTLSGTTSVTFPADSPRILQSHQLTVLDGRVQHLGGVVLDSKLPYYYDSDVEDTLLHGNLFTATRTCPDHTTSTRGFNGFTYLQMGSNPPFIATGPEIVVRRGGISAELTGTRVFTGAAITWTWDLKPVG